MVFKFVHFVELLMDYQLGKFQFCKLSLTSFIDRFRKHNYDFIMTSFHVFGDLKILNFLKLYIDLSKFQISWLSGSNFIEVIVRHQILPLFLVMTSFIIVELSNLLIL